MVELLPGTEREMSVEDLFIRWRGRKGLVRMVRMRYLSVVEMTGRSIPCMD